MATIFCFSSTGNSLYTAKRIAEKIQGEVVSMSGSPSICADHVIGFVFPVYFWGLPRIVERYITELQITNKDAYIFAVATHGGIAHGVIGRLNSLLRNKGLSLNYGRYLKSVENYIPGYKANDSETIRQSVDENISEMAGEIAAGRQGQVRRSTILNKLIYNFYPDKSSDQHFSVSAACTDCGICRKVCPVSNISTELGKPVFQHECEHCLACVHNCPANAIEWKQKTKGKERYRNSQIKLKELISFIGNTSL